MENFKDLPLWRQCYKIAFPSIYDENDTYEQAEFKKAYNMRNLSSGVSHSIIPEATNTYSLGNSTKSFWSLYTNYILRTLGSASYNYDNIINTSEKESIIKNMEFTYNIFSAKYSVKSQTSLLDSLAIYRSGNYGDYLTLLTLKIDNLNRRIKALEG